MSTQRTRSGNDELDDGELDEMRKILVGSAPRKRKPKPKRRRITIPRPGSATPPTPTKSASSFTEDEEKLIRATVPTVTEKDGEWVVEPPIWQAVFRLARLLRGIRPDWQVKDCRDAVIDWCERAAPALKRKRLRFGNVWSIFGRSFAKVQRPHGNDAVSEAMMTVMAEPVRRVMNYSTKECRLIALCRELQRAAGDEPFYLSCRKAGQVMAISHETAAAWLAAFVMDDILERVTTDDTGARRAFRYRYLLDDL